MGNTVSTSGGNTPVYFPSNASEWTLRDLSTLNISYNNSATDLSGFMDMLIRGSDGRALSNIDLPVRYKFMSNKQKDVGHFHLNSMIELFKQLKKKLQI